MKKIVLIPDSFKGTMSSREICDILRDCICRHRPDAEVIAIPVADGGEGSVDSFLEAVGGQRVPITVKGPYMKDMESFYGVINNGTTAIIEMAACAGLTLVGDDLRAEKTTTYGMGQLIADAVGRGCKQVIVGLGGSATNDFGAGAAAALGVRFLDRHGQAFIPVGETLARIAHIDTGGLLPGLREVELIAMTDVDCPLFGEDGAAYVFGPQKGADTEMIRFLDRQLRAVSEIVCRDLGVNVSAIPGAGAAGGMGGGMLVFLGAQLRMGIEILLDIVHFDDLVKDADLVVSGEGKIDCQSLRGKVVIGVARRAKRYNVPLVALVGDIGDDIDAAYQEGVTAIFSINSVAIPLREARKRSREDLRGTMDNLLRLLYAFPGRDVCL